MNSKIPIIALLITALFGFAALGLTPAQAQTITPTPTYDPFLQPPLPEHPTQLESGRYLFWRYCMPCHGDLGQGLTDEFRLKWEPDHQNCWARGCHSGRYADDSFPVPTVVPPLAGVNLLTRYTPDALFMFLRATHPPEDPGSLTEDNYRALVAFLYHMDNIPFPAATLTAPPAPTLTPVPSLTPTLGLPRQPQADSPFGFGFLVGLAILLTVIMVMRLRSRSR